MAATARTQGTRGVTKFLAVAFVLRFQVRRFYLDLRPFQETFFEHLRPTFKRNSPTLEDHDRRHVMERRDDRDGNGAARLDQTAH